MDENKPFVSVDDFLLFCKGETKSTACLLVVTRLRTLHIINLFTGKQK